MSGSIHKIEVIETIIDHSEAVNCLNKNSRNLDKIIKHIDQETEKHVKALYSDLELIKSRIKGISEINAMFKLQLTSKSENIQPTSPIANLNDLQSPDVIIQISDYLKTRREELRSSFDEFRGKYTRYDLTSIINFETCPVKNPRNQPSNIDEKCVEPDNYSGTETTKTDNNVDETEEALSLPVKKTKMQ